MPRYFSEVSKDWQQVAAVLPQFGSICFLWHLLNLVAHYNSCHYSTFTPNFDSSDYCMVLCLGKQFGQHGDEII